VGHPMGGGWTMLRSMRREQEMGDHKLGKDVAMRVVRFAYPFRWPIALFLFLVICSSVIAVATPVLAGDVINTISPPRGPDAAGKVIRIALLIAGLAVLDAGLTVVPGCTTTCSACRCSSSPAPRPARW
jgi:ATP-binding cassette subfamily B protein